jgi:hypothetical protein
MKKNVGAIDSIVRIILAIVIAVLYFTHSINGTAAIILGIIAVIFLLTAMMGFCPAYAIAGISTKSKEPKK